MQAMDYTHLRQSAVYQAATLIGNWQEERDLRRTVLQDMMAKKGTSTLRLDAYAERMSAGLQEVELTRVADDPYVHFGDVVQLVHLESACVLASDQGDGTPDTCAATGAPDVRAACARNSFQLLPYAAPKAATAERVYDDAVLRFGSKLRLAVHPAYALAGGSSSDGSSRHASQLFFNGCSNDSAPGSSGSSARPLCLFSKPLSMQASSKYTRNQLVGFTRKDAFDTVWEVQTPDPAQRALSQGLEVMAGAPVLLMHCATQKPLVLEEQKYPNDFGVERELSARVSCGNGLKLALEQTRVGLMRGALPRTDNANAFWGFMTGEKVQPPPEPTPTARDVAGLAAIQGVARELAARHGSIGPLERKLITWSSSASELPADEVPLLLRQVGLGTPADDVAALQEQFAVRNKLRVVDAAGMLAALRSCEA